MLNNQQRRDILNAAKAVNYEGSVMDLFAQGGSGVDVPAMLHAQQNQQDMQVAQTPQEQEVGLREQHAQGNTDASMAFPDVPPNSSFNTKGMEVPINISKFDEQGHLAQSFQNVPPGVQDLPTGPSRGTVIETPAYKNGGYIQKYQNGGEPVDNMYQNLPSGSDFGGDDAVLANPPEEEQTPWSKQHLFKGSGFGAKLGNFLSGDTMVRGAVGSLGSIHKSDEYQGLDMNYEDWAAQYQSEDPTAENFNLNVSETDYQDATIKAQPWSVNFLKSGDSTPKIGIETPYKINVPFTDRDVRLGATVGTDMFKKKEWSKEGSYGRWAPWNLGRKQSGGLREREKKQNANK